MVVVSQFAIPVSTHPQHCNPQLDRQSTALQLGGLRDPTTGDDRSKTRRGRPLPAVACATWSAPGGRGRRRPLEPRRELGGRTAGEWGVACQIGRMELSKIRACGRVRPGARGWCHADQLGAHERVHHGALDETTSLNEHWLATTGSTELQPCRCIWPRLRAHSAADYSAAVARARPKAADIGRGRAPFTFFARDG
jgi:hypothetical protein